MPGHPVVAPAGTFNGTSVLRLEVDLSRTPPSFDCRLTGLPAGADPALFVGGCIQALHEMLHQGRIRQIED